MWYAYPREEYLEAKIQIAFYDHSKKIWKPTSTPFENEKRSQGNPLTFSYKGELYLLFVLLNGHYWNSAKPHISRFHGGKFEVPHEVKLPEGVMTRHRPIIDEKGIILPAYHEDRKQTILYHSCPPFTDYVEIGSLEEGPIQADLIEVSEKEHLMILRPTDNQRKIFRAHSADASKSWPFIYRTNLDCPLSGVAATLIPGEKQKIIVAHNNTVEHRRSPLSLTFSHDLLKSVVSTWNLISDPGEFSYPSLIWDKQGFLHLVYTHQREKIGHYLIHRDDFPKEWNHDEY